MLLRPRRYEEGSPFPHSTGLGATNFLLTGRKRPKEEILASRNGGRLRRRRGAGGGLRRGRPRRLRGGAQEGAGHVLRRRRQGHGNGYEASLFTNSHIISNNDSQGNLASTCISKKQSDDDDLVETTNPTNAKKMRRMLSNRESAKRSRKKKQTHLDDLQSQVSRLTAENASLLKRLTDMTQKYKDASTNNRHHIADVEMMRRKVHIAEEAVRRVTGASMLVPPTMSDMHVGSMPLTSCASNAPSVAAAVQESIQHFAQEPLDGDTIKLDFSNETIPQNTGKMFTTAVSLCRAASLENLQKRVHQDSIHFGTALPLQDREPPIGDK